MNYEGAQEREVLACCVLFSFDVVKVCHDWLLVVCCVVVVVCGGAPLDTGFLAT